METHTRLSLGNATQTFLAMQVAFSGQSTFNLAPLRPLRTTDFSGDIRIFNDFGIDIGIIIGQYTLDVAPVPKPAGVTLLAVSGVDLLRRATPEPRVSFKSLPLRDTLLSKSLPGGKGH